MSIPISKYTSYGNNFVLIDETQGRILDETETSGFAHEVTDINFGVGADNFLAVQRCTHQTLETINGHRSYWTESPDPDCADFIFRMFESDGTEAFSCGNGLMSIAKYLFQTYQIRQARILTEIPTRTPTVVAIGTESDGHASWARMPDPRRVPDDMAVQLPRTPINDRVDGISRIELNEIRRSDSIRFFSNATAVALSGASCLPGSRIWLFLRMMGLISKASPIKFFFRQRIRNNPPRVLKNGRAAVLLSSILLVNISSVNSRISFPLVSI
ncbi:hypothetical protein [Desulfosarcina cetonica]|uniref:hypothetical protein n=1 Tax=Desulfosarcina cetonica TaxID=90730 RepID=UPI00155DC988|nr:hypothetical protein [Desulfosarcina cetonica]